MKNLLLLILGGVLLFHTPLKAYYDENDTDVQSPGQMRATSDQDRIIEQNIREALKDQYPMVSYQVLSGQVTLTGYVRNDSERKTIENRVRGVRDVKDVENRMQIGR